MLKTCSCDDSIFTQKTSRIRISSVRDLAHFYIPSCLAKAAADAPLGSQDRHCVDCGCDGTDWQGLPRAPKGCVLDFTGKLVASNMAGTSSIDRWGFPEMGVPLVIIHLYRIFPYKPSSYWGTYIYGTPQMIIDDFPSYKLH